MTDTALAPPDEAAADHVRAIVKRSGTSFFWAMRLLPSDKQTAMYAIYAYCRAVDDIADEPAPAAHKRVALGRWRDRIDALYRGRSDSALGDCLIAAIQAFDLRKEDFLAVLDGMVMDADGPIRAPDLATLELYCARVAGAVGLLSVRVFGCRDTRADDYALATGLALQLTNILRDLEEDAAVGRLYLPREFLSQAGIHTTEPDRVLADPALPQVCRLLAARARQAYQEAAALRARMRHRDARALRPAAIMTAVYGRLFDKMDRRGWDRPREPVRLSGIEKLGIVAKVLVFGQ